MTTDQRGTGFVRVFNGTVDIGVFEVQSEPALVVTVQPPASVAAGSPFGLTVQAEDSSGNLNTSFDGFATVCLPLTQAGPSSAAR